MSIQEDLKMENGLSLTYLEEKDTLIVENSLASSIEQGEDKRLEILGKLKKAFGVNHLVVVDKFIYIPKEKNK